MGTESEDNYLGKLISISILAHGKILKIISSLQRYFYGTNIPLYFVALGPSLLNEDLTNQPNTKKKRKDREADIHASLNPNIDFGEFLEDLFASNTV